MVSPPPIRTRPRQGSKSSLGSAPASAQAVPGDGLLLQPSSRHHRSSHGRRSSASSSSFSSRIPSFASAEPAFPLVSLLLPARVSVSRWITVSGILMLAGLFRWAVSLWDYSGKNVPPMFGDFEAQRHWMEVTANLPITEWYFHDLKWWGLDYPPLTAYHSWILGKIGSIFDPSFFALHSSRGLESDSLKLFMRASALASEYAVFMPAICVFTHRMARLDQRSGWESVITVAAILFSPALVLIDHGHFQYNSVMLGFFVATLNAILSGRWVLSCVWFVSSLCFKQMALFYAPAMFAYLLGSCVVPRLRVPRLILIAAATVLSFAAFYLPLVVGALLDYFQGRSLPIEVVNGDVPLPPLMVSLSSWVSLDESSVWYAILLQLTQSIHRIFPFARGLFEDKVANLWCALHTFHKLHRYPSVLLQRASLLLTLILVIPPSVVLFLKPRRNALLFGFAAVSWGFFLASYQVHEKNVLLPLLPTTLLLASHGHSARIRGWVGFANVLGTWTLFPLLSRDGLRIPYFVLTGLWSWLMGLPPFDWKLYSFYGPKPIGPQLDMMEKFVHVSYYFAMVGWHVAEAVVVPPEGKPDLWVVANVLVGASGFGLCYLWCLWNVVREGRDGGGLVEKESKVKKTE